MSGITEEPWIDSQVVPHSLHELEDCSIAVDATYYLRLILATHPYNEPLLPALGGPTGIKEHLELELDKWKAHKMIPFFIFDGQSIVGQDEVTLKKGLEANDKTAQAWKLYFNGQASEAVSAFDQVSDAYRPQNLYPLLQSILRERGLHFLVAPFQASAQIAYFDMIDSDQCAGIMGSLELMLYPINDCVIRSINWELGTAAAVSRKHVIKSLNVSEQLFIDGFLMTGTSFLRPFPALRDASLIPNQPSTILDAVNMLRVSEKSVAQTCNTYSDIIKTHDPNWLDKYRKARMSILHFIHITEDGEVKVHDWEHLTKDNHEYLGLQLPPEIFHYQNIGLISPRLLTAITRSHLYILPTIDGVDSPEYRKLVETALPSIREAAFANFIPRLSRGVGGKPIYMKTWYAPDSARQIWDYHDQKDYKTKSDSWNTNESTLQKHLSNFSHGSITSEVLSLKTPEFAAATKRNASQKTRGLDPADIMNSAGIIKSVAIWRFLHVRDYVNADHKLTDWGVALAEAIAAFQPTVGKYSTVPNLVESLIIAIDLLRFDLLNTRNKHEELRGLPMNGTEADQASLLLISRCATLLKLRHQATGYTGPLSKSLLAYRSLVSEVRSANRDLIEGLLVSVFLFAQANRKRDDMWQISHELPFLSDPDVALAIAVKTYLDDVKPSDSAEKKAMGLREFPSKFVPYAIEFSEDFEIACEFFKAIYAGVKAYKGKAISAADRAAWDRAAVYLAQRV